MGVALKPGTSAIALITSHEALKAIQQSVPVEDIHTAVGNLSEELSARLAENKNVAIGLLLSEEGLAVAEIAANEDGAQVVGAVITSDGIVAGEAVITDEGVAYKVAGANAEGAAMEAGVITDEGAVVVDAVATPESPESAKDDGRSLGQLHFSTKSVRVFVTEHTHSFFWVIGIWNVSLESAKDSCQST